jgi:hypothetical protein
MGLSRSSSGLLLYDDFSTDTEADYTPYDSTHDDWAVSGGDMVCSKLNGTYPALYRTGITTCKCVTGRFTESTISSYCGVGIINGVTGNGGYPKGAVGVTTDEGAPNGWWITAVDVSASAQTTGDCPNYVGTGTNFITRVFIDSGSTKAYCGFATLDESGLATAAAATLASAAPAILNYGVTGHCQWLEGRTSHLITCTGMTNGHYLRVSDGTTTAEAAASGGSASVDASAVIFPLTSVQVRTASGGGGTLVAQITSATLTDMGGGDAFTYTSSNHGLMMMKCGKG